MNLKTKFLAGILVSTVGLFADTWSFETPAAPNGGYLQLGVGQPIDGWTATGSCGSNCIMVVNTNYASESPLVFNAQDGNAALDLTGAGNTGFNGIERSFTSLIAGRTYNLTFWVGDINGNNPVYTLPAELQVSVTGATSQNFTSTVPVASDLNVYWTQHTYSFVAGAGPTLISFTNQVSGDNYVGLDNVSLNAVPEPVGFGVLSAGAAGLLLALRRRR